MRRSAPKKLALLPSAQAFRPRRVCDRRGQPGCYIKCQRRRRRSIPDNFPLPRKSCSATPTLRLLSRQFAPAGGRSRRCSDSHPRRAGSAGLLLESRTVFGAVELRRALSCSHQPQVKPQRWPGDRRRGADPLAALDARPGCSGRFHAAGARLDDHASDLRPRALELCGPLLPGPRLGEGGSYGFALLASTCRRRSFSSRDLPATVAAVLRQTDCQLCSGSSR